MKLTRLRPRLTYANVVSTLALVMATTGTAYAAATIGTSQVIDNSLLSRDVRNGTLQVGDMRLGTVNHLRNRVHRVQGPEVTVGADSGPNKATAVCPVGMYAIGGGLYSWGGKNAISTSWASDGDGYSVGQRSWTTWSHNLHTTQGSYLVPYAICLDAATATYG